MGLPSTIVLNRIMLGLNILLFVFLLWMLLVSPYRLPQTPAVQSAQTVADAFDLDVYCARGPFAIAVGDRAAPEEHYLFLAHGRPLSLWTEPSEETDGKARIHSSIHLGDDFSFSVDYSVPPTGVCEVHSFHLMTEHDKSLFDYNADGVFDLRSEYNFEKSVSKHYVPFEDEWQEVDEFIGQYHKRLAGGREVVFDMDSGEWLLVPEK